METVNEGTVTFTILNGTNVIASAADIQVINGTASTAYTLPPGTLVGEYILEVVYIGTPNLMVSTGPDSFLMVNPGPAYQLVFGQSPSDAVAGAPIGSVVTVLVEDQYGNVVTTDGSTVFIELGKGTFAGGLGTVAALASHGVARFDGLKIDKAGTYTLSATDATLVSSGPSETFTITPATAFRLAFEKEPSNAAAGAPQTLMSPSMSRTSTAT